ncbi:endonuclease VIII [Alteromonas lipolytica]|uniref:DNA-(apurinic or apyrimidinic site) lyase n=1 Tax=Alteromonas lipolytica TaxID=1856405 RepID=A0A1E8F8S6_9ALTE|nr:endonuclease VIII [Alteromonas lipolytica]OFI32317.1 endonuclease VII [Alteromonas lipolytica]GGF85522.1 endonuclease 8 [Alteromonas lipolytica]
MPEGPEIRQSADALAAVLKNKKINAITTGLAAIKPCEFLLTGHRVTDISCRGKAMLTQFDNGYTIYSHNQLYGRWMIMPAGELPDTKRSLRLALHTKEHSALLYSASEISLWKTAELDDHPFLKKLGPDVLNEPVTTDLIAERIASSRFNNRTLAALYLDQHFLAGIGNYLRSEILFFAGLFPDKKPKQLSDSEVVRLAEQTIKITEYSYRTGGYTAPVSDDKVKNHTLEEYIADRFMVFDRDDMPCRVCGETILRAERNNRRIYFCPHCQPG